LESSAKTKGFHYVTHPSPSLQEILHSWGRKALSLGEKVRAQSKRIGLRLWYNLNSFIYDQRGINLSEGSNDSVFGDSCQKGGELSPKQKGRTTTNFKNFVLNIYQLVSYCVQKGEKVVFQKWYIKTLLNTKRWISFRGSFCLVKGEHLKQGEKISNLKNALQILIHYL
jgi:hypothetical protein